MKNSFTFDSFSATLYYRIAITELQSQHYKLCYEKEYIREG